MSESLSQTIEGSVPDVYEQIIGALVVRLGGDVEISSDELAALKGMMIHHQKDGTYRIVAGGDDWTKTL